MRKREIFILGTVIFFFFVLFSYLVHKNLLVQFDFDTTVRLQDKISRRFDHFFSLFSIFGSFEVTSIFILGLVLLRRKILEGVYLVAFAGFLFIELFGKIMVQQPGPPILFARYQYDLNYPTSYIPHPTDAYPSGHSGRTVFICTILIYLLLRSRLPVILKVISVTALIGFIGIMLLSRVYLGEHWATDVIGGTLLGLALALISIGFVEYTKKVPWRTYLPKRHKSL